jgi:ADP-ribosylglycohydrolase
MSYPELPNLNKLVDKIICYSQLKHEYGVKNISRILKKAEKSLNYIINDIKKLKIDKELTKKEPNDLKSIKKLRPDGPRRLWKTINKETYLDKLEGALLGRFAGCTLGAPVEFWDIEKMKLLAKENNTNFPPKDYWTYVPFPYQKRYQKSPIESYTRNKMDGVPVDDDIVYTILGLLIIENYGLDFHTNDVGKAWLKFLPYACTAEAVALENLKNGINPLKSGEINNPYCEWIGAYIRSDPWGYIAAGWPEKAAEMAYRDAFISHRRQGIYGEMFFSAVISSAFVVDNPIEAIKIGLSEIPKDCALTKSIKWALDVSPEIKNYEQAREKMEKKFKGMNKVHTINNACLTIWGLTIGDTDFTKVIGETVAMGMDNDCTAATAGSIIGAILGKKAIPKHWYEGFNNKVYTYLNGKEEITITELVDRFFRQAENLYKRNIDI